MMLDYDNNNNDASYEPYVSSSPEITNNTSRSHSPKKNSVMALNYLRMKITNVLRLVTFLLSISYISRCSAESEVIMQMKAKSIM